MIAMVLTLSLAGCVCSISDRTPNPAAVNADMDDAVLTAVIAAQIPRSSSSAEAAERLAALGLCVHHRTLTLGDAATLWVYGQSPPILGQDITADLKPAQLGLLHSSTTKMVIIEYGLIGIALNERPIIAAPIGERGGLVLAIEFSWGLMTGWWDGFLSWWQ